MGSWKHRLSLEQDFFAQSCPAYCDKSSEFLSSRFLLKEGGSFV